MIGGHDFLCVGAGFSGAVFARAVADAGKSVLVIDKSEHLAGHAHDGFDEHGVLVHRYGPHVFHTDDDDVYEFLVDSPSGFPTSTGYGPRLEICSFPSRSTARRSTCSTD